MQEMERSADVLAAGLLEVSDPSLSSKFFLRQVGFSISLPCKYSAEHSYMPCINIYPLQLAHAYSFYFLPYCSKSVFFFFLALDG